MKYLLLLALFVGVGALVYWRLRPYINFARRVFGFMRDPRRLSPDDLPSSPATRRSGGRVTGERLVRCSSCGTWLPASRALAARSSADSYCSTDCLERAAARKS